jgi:hypothetical protein
MMRKTVPSMIGRGPDRFLLVPILRKRDCKKPSTPRISFCNRNGWTEEGVRVPSEFWVLQAPKKCTAHECILGLGRAQTIFCYFPQT